MLATGHLGTIEKVLRPMLEQQVELAGGLPQLHE
jgi:hypothetical protein